MIHSIIDKWLVGAKARIDKMKINDGLKKEKKEKLDEKAKQLKKRNVTPLVHDIGVEISGKGKGKGKGKSTPPTESFADRLKRLRGQGAGTKPSPSKPSSKPSSSKPKTRERTKRKG